MIPLIKASLPGSIFFLIASIVLGLLLQWKPKTKHLGIKWLVGIFMCYVMFSMPITARLVVKPLERGFHSLEATETSRNVQAVVVLDGGTARFRNRQQIIEIPLDTSVLRALEVLRVYRLLANPLVFVSGGDNQADPSYAAEATVLSNQLIIGGIPKDRIILDSNSINTREHSVHLVRMLRERGIKEFVLVTSPSHMRRAMWAFQAEGVNPIPSPCKGSLDHEDGWIAWWPSTKALEFTQAAMHEYFGIVYYYFHRKGTI